MCQRQHLALCLRTTGNLICSFTFVVAIYAETVLKTTALTFWCPQPVAAVMVLPPPWLTGKIEAPAGTKSMGSWTAKVFTPEQQARLGVDELGNKVSVAASSTAPARPVPAASRIGLVGPAWTRGEMERPAGTKDMGTYKTLVYTPEQQERLGVDENGNQVAKTAEVPVAAKASSPAPMPAAPAGPGRIGLVGPAWTRGEMERPAGTKDMGTYTTLAYTPEQQERLGVDEDGKPVAKPVEEKPVKAGSKALAATHHCGVCCSAPKF
eukprot:s3833_g4.t1